MDNKKTEPKPQIAPLPNGPYYLLNEQKEEIVPNLQTSKGEPRACRRGVALCRCGASNSKPFCDGTHAMNGFQDKKLEGRQPDRRESYAGKKITIHDNRGICAHAGFCTSKLKSVFQLNKEPWIDPNGAEVDEIVETIRKCPSGALSYAIEGTENEGEERSPMVTVAKNGPYAVTGGIELLGVQKGEGASEEHCTLCRCGGSKNKSFCDGTHWHIKFQDERN